MTIFVYGDETEAAKYRSTVEHYKTEMVRNFGQTSKNQSYWRQLSDIAKVHLRLVNGQPFAYLYVGIIEVYMESGFLFHESNYSNNELAYLPSMVRFNNFVERTSLINGISTRPVSDGMESWAVGGTDKVKEITGYSVSGVPYTFTSETPIYIVDLWKKKLYQTNCPPSVFTGKLRLMVQALYGSKRDDYFINIDPDTNRPMPSLAPYLNLYDSSGNTIRLDSYMVGGSFTYGLYRDPLNGYWLIRPTSGPIYARKMLYNKKLLEKYSLADNELNETYILSTLIPDDTEVMIEGVSGMEGESGTEGFYPFTYGWKFNQRGDEFSIVVTRTATNLSTEAGVDGMENKLLTVRLVFNSDTGLPEVESSTVVAQGFHILYAQTKIFIPVHFLGIMECMTQGHPGNTYANLSAPLYCYYTNTGVESDSELTIVTVKNGLITTENKSYWQWYNEWSGSHEVDYYESAMSGIYEGTKYTTGLSGLTISNAIDNLFESECFNYPGNVTTASYNVIPDETPVDGIEPLYRVSDGAQISSKNSYKIDKNSICGHLNSYSNIVHSIVTLAVIPAYDAEAIFLGNQIQSRSDRQTTMTYTFNNNVWWKSDMYKWINVDGQVVYTDFLEYQNYNMSISIGDFASSSYSGDTIPDSIDFGIDVTDIISQEMWLYTSVQGNTKQIYAGYRLASVLTPALKLDALIYVSFDDPFFYNLLSVRSSYSGAFIWDMVQGLGGKKDWPVNGNIEFSTPVGWS